MVPCFSLEILYGDSTQVTSEGQKGGDSNMAAVGVGRVAAAGLA